MPFDPPQPQKRFLHVVEQVDAPLGEVENKVGADDEVTLTAKNSTAVKKLFANTSQFAKLRYEGYKKLSEEK